MKIITDSTCDWSLEDCARRGVEMLSLRVRFGDEEYLDKRTITNDAFYSRLVACRELPKTSMVSVGDFEEAFGRYPDEEIVAIFLSSELSGTCQSALAAKQELGREDIYIIDSRTATVGLGLLVEAACRLRDAGRSARETADEVGRLCGKLRLYGVVDTLQYLVMGGRLPRAVGTVAEMLSYKPIMTLRDGRLVRKEIVRGKKAAVERLIRLGLEEHKIDAGLPVGFAGIHHPEGMDRLLEAFAAYPDRLILEIGSVIGTHVGPGCLILAFFAA